MSEIMIFIKRTEITKFEVNSYWQEECVEYPCSLLLNHNKQASGSYLGNDRVEISASGHLYFEVFELILILQ